MLEALRHVWMLSGQVAGEAQSWQLDQAPLLFGVHHVLPFLVLLPNGHCFLNIPLHIASYPSSPLCLYCEGLGDSIPVLLACQKMVGDAKACIPPEKGRQVLLSSNVQGVACCPHILVVTHAAFEKVYCSGGSASLPLCHWALVLPRAPLSWVSSYQELLQVLLPGSIPLLLIGCGIPIQG